jgi:SAM-dependent methyltransferase
VNASLAGTGGFGARSLTPVYLAVGLVAGAVIALQISIMRIFAVGSWAHFGSLVVSLAMLGFGLTSAVMCIFPKWFERHWRILSTLALLAFGPLAVASNLIAQQFPFNAIFLVSDPVQKWRLALNFVLYLTPFLAGALFLGVVFQRAQTIFNRVYFADLVGSGICGLLLLLSMYALRPQDLIAVPLVLWAAGSLLWFLALGNRGGAIRLVVVAALTLAAHFVLPGMLGVPKIAISDYKGVSYARKFPDSKRILESTSPFGYLEVYSSSYLHFAPGLSDNAAFNLAQMPKNAYLGLYSDSEGPIGIIRKLPPEQTAYYRYLPMFYPYLIKDKPQTFVAQFSGGLSTALALAAGSSSVTVAEGDRGILDAFRTQPVLREFTGDILNQPGVEVIDYEGRIYLAGVRDRFDIVDLSLADSAGLSSPGGFAIIEKYAYTRQAMAHYMQALKPDGVLSVTLWNKEEPPKSVLKLYATMAAAAREVGGADISRKFFVVSAYLSSTTVLFKRDGFSEAELALLRKHTAAMSFDEIYSPGLEVDTSAQAALLGDYRAQIFGSGAAQAVDASKAVPISPTVTPQTGSAADSQEPPPGDADAPQVLPSIQLGRLAWHALVTGQWDALARDYVFDTRVLSNAQPYFAAYVKFADLPRVTDRLELLQDEWGFLLIWATLGVACIAALSLVLLPLVFGWRTIFSRYPGKARTIVYFACLGLGYIMVEVGLIAHFILALGNATISASVLITGMLIFSGLGSFVSERVLPQARRLMPVIFGLIGAILIGYGLWIDHALDAIAALPYAARLLWCFALIAPPAFLMGFPMPVAMTTLGRLGKEAMFLWAWGINGCFSVIGAALVPVLATSFGLHSVLAVSGAAYLLALPMFYAVLKPLEGRSVRGALV